MIPGHINSQWRTEPPQAPAPKDPDQRRAQASTIDQDPTPITSSATLLRRLTTI